MSDLLQFGHHPDADQLNAFVEHALPLHEYEQTLAHLAVCSDCRSIVAFSMPPMEEAPVLQAKTVRKSWFPGWKLAWPTAAAFAALAIVVLYIRNTTNLPNTGVSIQRADSPSPVPAPEKLTKPNALVGPVSHQGRLSSSTTKNSVGISSRNAAAPSNQSSDLRAHAPSSPDRSAKVINGNQPDSLIASAGVGSGNGGVLSQHPAPTVTDSLHQNRFNAGAASSAVPASPLASPASVGGPLRRPYDVAPTHAATLNAFNQNPEVTTAAAPMALSFNGRNVGLNEAGGVLAQHPLPSHLPAISMVSANHQILAIDTQNSLFFSGDEGKSWKAISPQWQGRAVKVVLVSSETLAKMSSGIAVGNIASPSFASQTAPARAQDPGASSVLTGKVTDTTGAAIPDASIVVTGTEAANVHNVKTDHSGSYAIGGLVPGHYQIAARAPGFQEQVSAVNVASSEQGLANFALPIGSTSETVTVEATALPLVELPTTNREIAEPSIIKPPPLFEITTEDGNHWISVDGQTWKPK